MSRMNDLQADRDRRLFNRHLGEDGMDGFFYARLAKI